MLVSVIVLNYNGAHLLPECIESLQKQDYKDIEIIVADNASNDNSIQVAKSYGVKIHKMEENRGFSFTNNSAAKIANGESIFFVNNDMKFEKNCISELVKEISKDPDIFAVDPLQYNWDGTEVIHGGTAIKKSGLKNWFPFIYVDYLSVIDKKIEVPWGCAGSLMVRKKMFEKLNGFDNTFFWMEKTWICVGGHGCRGGKQYMFHLQGYITKCLVAPKLSRTGEYLAAKRIF